MNVVLYVSCAIFGAVFCYLLLLLGVVDAVDGVPGAMQEPAIAIPTYLGFMSAMMTAVTVVLAAVAIGIGVVAFFTFGEIKGEARKIASERVNEMVNEKLSDEAIKARIDEITFALQGPRGELDEDFDPDDTGERQEGDSMTSREYERIEGSNRKILDRYRAEYPVKLGKLANELGVSIKVSSMSTGVSGQIMKENGRYIIRVNRHEARERQRFTIAHELSHFFLHKSIIDSSPDGIKDNVLYRSGEPERIEYEANRLAADIVMPMPLVKEVLRKEFGGVVTEATIESLASRFQVSKAAMEIRLSTFAEA